MAEWHLAELRSALAKRGWQIAQHPGDEYRFSGAWEIRRSGDARVLWIEFHGLDDMRTLPLDQSYGCGLRGDPSGGLHFRRARRDDLWKRDLAVFVESLETWRSA